MRAERATTYLIFFSSHSKFQLLAVEPREIVYLLFKKTGAFLPPILQDLHGREVP